MTTFVNPTLRKRLFWLAGLLTGGYVALSAWIGYWQLFRHDEYARLAAQNRRSRWTEPAPRGMIMDIHGTVLAASAPVKTVCVDPGLALLPPDLDYCRRLVSRVIADELNLDYTKVLSRTKPRWFINSRGSNVLDRFEVLTHNVPLQTWNRLRRSLTNLDYGLDLDQLPYTNRLRLKAMRTKLVFSRDSYQRRYPGGRLASHVLGLVRSFETNSVNGAVQVIQGVAGIEEKLDSVLSGTPGWHLGSQTVEARPGLNVVLTLDAGVQAIMEDELRTAVRNLRPKAAFAVAVRPSTGDILGLANWPDYDPAHPEDAKALQNWAISTPLEPGSTMKGLSFAAAWEHRLLRWEDKIFCENGYWGKAPGGRIRDHGSHGLMTCLEVLAKSSNIGTAKLVLERVGAKRMVDTLTAFGLGSRTGVPLPHESAGILHPNPSRTDLSRMAFGHAVTATALQMTMAYAAIANGGVLMHPRLVDRIVDENGVTLRAYPPVVFRRAISERAARELIKGLQEVVSVRGTARRAKLELYSVAGKTGTAEVTYENARGYNGRKNYASFVGFFPTSNPEVCLLVGVLEPQGRYQTGGAVAAPPWRNMAEQIASYLRIRPDLQPDLDWLPGEVPSGLTPLTPLTAQAPVGTPRRRFW